MNNGYIDLYFGLTGLLSRSIKISYNGFNAIEKE